MSTTYHFLDFNKRELVNEDLLYHKVPEDQREILMENFEKFEGDFLQGHRNRERIRDRSKSPNRDLEYRRLKRRKC